MVKANRRIGSILLVCVAFILFSYATTGCEYFPESSFELANESRLPKWFNLPPGINRSDVSVTLNYYSVPWGNSTIFNLHDGKGHVIGKIGGNAKNREPLHLHSSPTGYPLFEVISANGTTEIIEHKKMEPVFYVTDDPAVWTELIGVHPPTGNPTVSHK